MAQAKTMKMFLTKVIQCQNCRNIGPFRNISRSSTLLENSVKVLSSQDILMSNFRNALNTADVLNMVNQHHQIMNKKHIMTALRTLFTLQKEGRTSVTTQEIIRHPNFEKLCIGLKRQAGIIEIPDIIDALKVVTFVGVRPDSTITQVLLQLIRQNINFLSLKQIIFIDFLLTRYQTPNVPLIEALKIALPLVFEINLPLKIDSTSTSFLSESLYFASRNYLSDQSIDLLINSLLTSKDLIKRSEAKSILWSLTELEPRKTFEPLVHKCIALMTAHIDEFSFADIDRTLGKSTAIYKKKQSAFYYNEAFFEAVSNHVISKNVGFTNALRILRKITNCHYCNTYLIDYICQEAQRNEQRIKNAEPLDIYNLVEALAMCNYKPKGWDSIMGLIEQRNNLHESERREISWLAFAANLCSLNIFKEDVIKKAFNENLGYVLNQRKRYQDFQYVFTILYCIDMYKPELNELVPKSVEPNLLVTNMPPLPSSSLKEAVEIAFGGSNYVKSTLLSRLGHQIDHIVVFRKGGYPVALPEENLKFIEDIHVSPDNQIVAIICLTDIHHTINDKRIRLMTEISIRRLEKEGYTVVPIILETWNSLSDFEKIPYIVQNVNSRIDRTQSELTI